MWGLGRWKAAGLATLIVCGVALGRIDGAGAPGITAGRALLSPQPDQKAMFDAIVRLLAQAHVQPHDMPKHIITVTPMGADRYRIHMQMVDGEGWFELTWDGRAWQVKGLPAPPGTNNRRSGG